MVTEVEYTTPDNTSYRAVVEGTVWFGVIDSDNEISNQIRAWIAEGNTPTPHDPEKYPAIGG